MANGSDSGDLSPVCLDLLLGSAMTGYEIAIASIVNNAETAYSIVRLVGADKFHREEPLEAAAAEVILSRA